MSTATDTKDAGGKLNRKSTMSGAVAQATSGEGSTSALDDFGPGNTGTSAKPYATLAPKQGPRGYQYNMSGHAAQCVDRYLELSGKSMDSLKPVSYTHLTLPTNRCV